MTDKVHTPDDPETPDDISDQRPYSRRRFLGLTSAAIAAAALSGGAADAQTRDASKKGRSDGPSPADHGPENAPAVAENPDANTPPYTDSGEVPNFWQSFSLSHKRIQEGGWARQINVQDFPISKDIAGVNFHLTAGGVRELHWHDAGEWSIVLSGSCRLTAIDDQGRSYVQDVTQGDLWYFPSGIPHSIQGLGPDGCEFLLVFDDGAFSEGATSLLSDWVTHTPHEVLAKNWNAPLNALAPLDTLPNEGLYIFQAPVPPPLAQDRRAAAGGKPPSPLAFDFKNMMTMPPAVRSRSGEVRVVDSTNFPISKTLAAALVTIHPGGVHELHWHPNAGEWQFWLRGTGRMTLFATSGKARTADFHPGDVGYVPFTQGHYIENTGSEDLVYLSMFRSERFRDLSLNDWLTHTPPELVRQHLRISQETLDSIPRDKYETLPA